MVFFVVCLLALGLSYFFGLMTGLSSRRPPKSAAAPEVTTPAPAAEMVSTPVRTPVAGGVPALTRIAEEGRDAGPPAPPVLQALEDGGAEEPPPAPAAAASAARRPASGAAEIWIQVASLTARREADA